MANYGIEIAKNNLKDFIELQYDKKYEIELEEKRKSFVNRFTKDYILNVMQLDDYIIGKGDHNNFCYIVERTLRELGSILGATSYKFGIYWSDEVNDYNINPKFNQDKYVAFEQIKDELVKIIDASQQGNIDLISDSKISYMFKYKIFYLYNVNADIPIFSQEHLKKVLDYFEIQYPKGRNVNVEIEKRKALLNFKNNDEDFSKMSNFAFMLFLYNELSGLDLKAKEVIEKNKKDDSVDLVEVSTMLDTSSNYNYVPKKGKTNYEDVAAKKSYIGDAGEKLVLEYERNHHPQFKNKIKRVSEDNDHLGYDIKSYDDAGNEIHIEVKTKKRGNANNVDFFITKPELDKFQSDLNYVIYYVCGILTKHKTIYAIRKENLEQVEPQPILFRVKAKILN